MFFIGAKTKELLRRLLYSRDTTTVPVRRFDSFLPYSSLYYTTSIPSFDWTTLEFSLTTCSSDSSKVTQWTAGGKFGLLS